VSVALITLQARPSSARCPVCRDDLAAATSRPLVRCPQCGVCAHGSCARELGRCATFGCAAARRIPVQRVGPRPPAARRAAPSRPAGANGLVAGSLALTASLPIAIVTIIVEALGRTSWDAMEGFVVHAMGLALLGNVAGTVLGIAGIVRSDSSNQWATGLAAVLVNALPWLATLAVVLACS
jgi:hypothetical protein